MNRRKKYFIYPPFQIAIIFANVVGILACIAILTGMISSLFSEMITLGKQAGFPDDHPYFQFISMQGATIVKRFMIAAGIGLVLNTALFIWLSHRLVGPIYGLKLYLIRYRKARERGETVGPISFRKNDFFKDLAEHVNGALETDVNAKSPARRNENDQ